MGPYTNRTTVTTAWEATQWEPDARSGSRRSAPARPRDADFTTMSGIPVEPVYGPDDGEFPGVYPYTRGPVRVDVPLEAVDDADVRRLRHRRRHQLAVQGDHPVRRRRPVDRVRHADAARPRLRRPDEPRARSAAAAWPSTPWPTWRTSTAASTSATITTSMTINSPAAVIFAMYVAQAETAGVPRARLGGTLQNDILKEYQAQKEFVFPPRQSMRLVRDTIDFTAAEMPRWHSISISGYHIREAGSTAAEELAFTLANGFAYVELALQAGLPVDAFAPAAQLLLQRPHRLLRGDRQVPGGPAHLGPLDEGALRRPAGALAAAALPHPDRRRVAHRAAARGEHRAHGDRGAGRRARRHAEPAHQLDGRGAGAADREGGPHRPAHPAGASPTRPTWPTSPIRSAARYFVEALTDEVERQAEEIFAHLDELGIGLDPRGRDPGHRGELVPGQASPTRPTSSSASSTPAGASIVGVNRFTEGNDEDPIDILQITNEDEARQIKRLDAVRQDRDDAAVAAALEPAGPGGGRPRGQPHADADRHREDATPRSARSWARWPASSGATSRCRRSDRPAMQLPSRSGPPITQGGSVARSVRHAGAARRVPGRAGARRHRHRGHELRGDDRWLQPAARPAPT